MSERTIRNVGGIMFPIGYRQVIANLDRGYYLMTWVRPDGSVHGEAVGAGSTVARLEATVAFGGDRPTCGYNFYPKPA